MNKGTVFTTKVNNTDYQYVTNEDLTISPINGVYQFNNVKIYEGTLVTFKYTYDVNDVDQKFIIPADNADTTKIVQPQTQRQVRKR